MKITIEISLYPLKEDYTGVIIDFIKNLKKHDSVNVHSTAMSTYVSGDYDMAMNIVSSELKKIHQIVPDSCTVMKIIPKDLNVEKGFLNF